MSDYNVRVTGEEAAILWRQRQPRAAYVVTEAISHLRQMRQDFVELRVHYSGRIPPECMAGLRSAFDALEKELEFFEQNPGSL